MKNNDLHKLSELYESSIRTNIAYHITYKDLLPRIRESGGLLVHSPDDMDDKPGIYLFPSVEDAEDALMNWLGDRLDDKELVLLKIDITGLNCESDVDYEIRCNDQIPYSRILSIEEI